ncbi:MAG: serine hydroxymethyltransferase, partial [Marinosulfonomonas sp.]
TLLDWIEHGAAYAGEMVALAQALARELAALGLSVFAAGKGATTSHQFAIKAAEFGGGQAASKTLRKAGFLACGIGLPIDPVDGDMNGLRIGTPELVRFGATPENVVEIADLVARALLSNDPESLAPETAALRAKFSSLHYMIQN